MRKDARMTIAPMSEYHFDLLMVAAWLGRKSLATQATNLICEGLDTRLEEIRSQVSYLAAKRGISTDELWSQIISGDAAHQEDG
ncbi:hypothetical protein ACE1CD_15350 [Aerosakkonema sp. BLCC-F183]|uniref:hypothetical protein n=1 Tax=Aerosakkonema sp. BLCC-F183 TaxID=3342834 RepID=UPI0035B84DBA